METEPISPQIDHDLIFNIFQAAMSRPEGQREEFVRASCLRRGAPLDEVQRRVKWEARMNGFLLKPVLARERLDRPFAEGDTLLNRFRIMRLAGEGGMGIVYEAFDQKLGHRIALKCAHFEYRRHLSPEALKSIRVTHPNVCRVFEIHTADTESGDVDFLTMEFLEGETLAAHLKRAPANWLQTTDGKEIARQICSGLRAVHSEGIIHRDLKPGNVMLCKSAGGKRRAVIMDFGVAQSTDVFASQIRGTPSYIAPELWRGQAATVQSDLYAMGVLLYQMASGRLPFSEETEWSKRLDQLPPAPCTQEQFRATILRCLQPAAERRFQSVSELEEALRDGISRRWILGTVSVLAASGTAGMILQQRFRPTSAIRVALLPPGILTEKLSDGAPILIQAFMQNVSFRLKTEGGTRRPISIVTPAQTGPAGAVTAGAAKDLFSATHIVTSSFKRDISGWSIAADLIDTANGAILQSWNRNATTDTLAEQLFSLEQNIVDGTNQRLRLRSEPQRQTLTRESYADYLNGLYYARFDYDNAAKAIPFFERVIAAAPQSALGYAGLAEALLGVRGDKSAVAKAQEAVGRAELLDPDAAHVHYIKGRLNVKAHWYELGLEELRRAAHLDPHNSEIFIETAYAYYGLHRMKEAEEALRRAIAAEPGYYKPYLDAGQFYFLQGNFGTAERHWLSAVRFAPGQTQARLNLAELYIGRQRLRDAETQIVESLKVRKNQDVLAKLAELQARNGNRPRAISSYEEALHMGPPSYTIWADLASLYRRDGRASDATRAFRQGLALTEEGIRSYPREADRVAMCAYYYANLGDVSQTRERAAQALEMHNPPAADVRRLLVLAYDSIHDKDAALNLLAGATPDLLAELARSPDLSDALRRNSRFQRMTRQ